MNNTLRILAIAIIFPVALLGQQKVSDCSKVKNGTFYFYPTHTHINFIIVRSDSIQREFSENLGDTSYWKIKWQDDCLFSMKFIRKGGKMSKSDSIFFNSHTALSRIISVTKDYYTCMGGLDEIPATNTAVDTLWFKPR